MLRGRARDVFAFFFHVFICLNARTMSMGIEFIHTQKISIFNRMALFKLERLLLDL